MVAKTVRVVSDTLLWFAGLAQGMTGLIALAALGVSLYNLHLQRRDKRPQLKITGSLSTLMEANLKPAEDVYMINVANTGQMPTAVTQVYLWDKPDRKIAFPNISGEKPLPCKLDPGDGANWWVGYEALREALRRSGHRGTVRVKLEATDQTGRSHTTRTKIKVNAH